MSSPQKYQEYSIVPWYNTAEWQNVYQRIFSKKSTKNDQRTALDMITMWQMRTPHLPSGVEGTLCILEALLIDNENLSERQYQILCGSSIMRFLNICVAHRAQIYSFTRTVRENSIPDWIISIRHDFAHSQKLPSVALLNLALEESFRWLEATYWKPELSKMADNIITGVSTMAPKSSSCSLEMYELMGLHCNIFVYDALSLCYNEFIQDKLELVDASSKINEYPKAIIYLLEKGVENLCEYEWDKCFDEILYSHFYTVHPNTLIDKKGSCSPHYTNLGNLFNLIEKHQKLSRLVRELLHLCSGERESIDSRNGVAHWLDEIFKGMLRFRRKKSAGDASGGIHFKQLHKETVRAMQKLKHFVVTTVPEQFRKFFISNFLILIDTKDVAACVKEFNKRTVVYQEDEMEDSLKMQQEEMDYEKKIERFFKSMDNGVEQREILQNGAMDTSEPVLPTNNETISCKRWNLVSDTSLFESCAIGVVPAQWTCV